MWVWIGLALAGCQALTPQAPATPTVTPRALSMTQFVGGLPTPTATPVLPSATLRPSATPLPLPASATPAPPQPSAPPQSTLPPAVQALGATDVSLSPDRQWYVALQEKVPAQTNPDGGATYYQVTHLVSADGKTAWTIQPAWTDLDGKSYGSVAYVPLFWLQSEPFVYLAGQVKDSDDRRAAYNGWNLVRLDLRSGAVSKQIPGWDRHFFSFSPQGDLLFDGLTEKPWARVISLVTGAEVTLPFPAGLYADGPAAFSPDRGKVAAQGCQADAQSGNCASRPLLIMDLKDASSYPLVADLAQSLGTDGGSRLAYEWVDPRWITIAEKTGGAAARRWKVDVLTRQVVELPGTP